MPQVGFQKARPPCGVRLRLFSVTSISGDHAFNRASAYPRVEVLVDGVWAAGRLLALVPIKEGDHWRAFVEFCPPNDPQGSTNVGTFANDEIRPVVLRDQH